MEETSEQDVNLLYAYCTLDQMITLTQDNNDIEHIKLRPVQCNQNSFTYLTARYFDGTLVINMEIEYLKIYGIYCNYFKFS